MVKCPHCGNEISPAAILGKEGGKKSRRVLTTEQAMAMVEARERKKAEKEIEMNEVIQILKTEDVRLVDGRYSSGFVDEKELQKLILEGKAEIYQNQGMSFVRLAAVA